MRIALALLAILLLGGCLSAKDVPPEAQVAGACNTYGNAINAAEAYRILIPDDTLFAINESHKSVTRTCEAARQGMFVDGATTALFLVTEATNTLVSVVCGLNPEDPTC